MAKRTSSARGTWFLVTALLGAAGAGFAVLRGRSRPAPAAPVQAPVKAPVPVPASGVPEPGVPVAPAAPGSPTPPPAPVPTAADFPPEAPSNAVRNFEEATAPPDADGTGHGATDGAAGGDRPA